MIGPHVLQPTPAALDWLRRAPICKVVGDNVGAAAPLAEAPEGALRIYRHWFSDAEQLAALGGATTHIVDSILAGIGPYGDSVDYVELLNETGQRLGQGLEPHVNFVRRATRSLHRYGLRTAAFSLSWGGWEWDDASYLAYKKYGNADAVALHNYWETPGEWSGYQMMLDAAAAANAKTPRLVLTEVGRGNLGDPALGWQASGLSAEQYADELRQFDTTLPAEVLGATVFTAGAPTEWASFDADSIPDLV